MRTAAYARFSSDSQREASIEDQLRVCREHCGRQGWPVPVVFSDAAITGARHDRPGYARLLATAHEFDVIVVDDLTRLARDQVETQRLLRRLKFAGIRLIAVSDSLDTAREDAKLNAGLRGLMGELYLDDLAKKTHRGLTGRALSGASAGGLPYGYRVAGVGQRAIDEAQAAVVRQIFAEFVAGASPRAIAACLNRDGVPPPRGRTWSMTAIRADLRRGLGILGNPIYAGQQVWNRSRWVKHPETGRRVRQERPRADWITTDHPELAIVDSGVWAAAQRRLGVTATPQRGKPGVGRPAKYLLSGLLRCGECGGPMVVIDRYRYGCATAKDRGTCSSTLRFPRRAAEAALLAGVREPFLSEEAFQRLQKAVRAALKRQAPDTAGAERRLAAAQRERENIMGAIRQGIVTASTRDALFEAEAAERSARAELDAQRTMQPATMVPRLRERWQGMVAAIGDQVRDVPRARDALREMLGEIVVRANENGDPVAEIAASSVQITVVAGAGFVSDLTGPVRIPLTSGRES